MLVTSDPQTHPAEPHVGAINTKLNWLRAGVLGANDGIVSVAGIVIGVAAATADRAPILTAGIAGLVAGALSMALGEYVSVSTQRDTEQALLDKERRELIEEPEAEFEELVGLYRGKGLSPETARTVAQELTDHDAFAAHAVQPVHGEGRHYQHQNDHQGHPGAPQAFHQPIAGAAAGLLGRGVAPGLRGCGVVPSETLRLRCRVWRRRRGVPSGAVCRGAGRAVHCHARLPSAPLGALCCRSMRRWSETPNPMATS